MIPKASIPRLTKLLVMLSSPSDGEALAAVRAIGRALEAEGANWHDFAALMAPRSSKPSPAPKRPAQPESKPESKPATEYDYSTGSEKLFRTLLLSKLTDWEREFVTSVYKSWQTFGRLTKKQAKVILDIKAKTAGTTNR